MLRDGIYFLAFNVFHAVGFVLLFYVFYLMNEIVEKMKSRRNAAVRNTQWQACFKRFDG